MYLAWPDSVFIGVSDSDPLFERVSVDPMYSTMMAINDV